MPGLKRTRNWVRPVLLIYAKPEDFTLATYRPPERVSPKSPAEFNPELPTEAA